MSPAPVWSSWLKTNWLRWEPPHWEMRAQQLNRNDIDVETNCITRPQRSELTCSAHDCCAAVLARQRQWAVAKSKTIHDPRGSFVTGHMTTAPLFSWNESVGPAVLSNRNQVNLVRGPRGVSNLRIIVFAAAICWQDATCARLFRLKVQWLRLDDLTTAFKIPFLAFASSFRSSCFQTGRVQRLVWCVTPMGLNSLYFNW